MEISVSFSSAKILKLVWNVIKFLLSRVFYFSLHAIYQRWNIISSFTASNAEVFDVSAPASLKHQNFCSLVASLRLAALSRRAFFLAASVMRLHEEIFYDTKTLLSETFFSISTELPQPSPSQVNDEKKTVERRKEIKKCGTASKKNFCST